SEANENSIKSSLKDMEDIDGLILIPKIKDSNFDDLEQNTLVLTNKEIGFDTKNEISNDLEEILRNHKIKNLSIETSKINDLDKDFQLKTENLNGKNNDESSLSYGVKYGLSLLLMYVVFMFILMYGVRVMRSVLEEKNNRVVEIIISSVKPFQLMMGKILGVTLVALTQFSIWIVMSIIGASVLNSNLQQLPISTTENQINIQQTAGEIAHTLLEMNFILVIIVFIIFFLFGYIFYSAIYAAIGSSVDSETDSQQFTLFTILPLTLAMYGSISVGNNPDGPLVFWLSMIPFTSPVTMVARIPFGVPIWQILLSISLLIGSCILMVIVAGKIYRVGILMHGNKATLKEIWKWIRN
ncbi:MAG: ABC transporter permease, partial [Bergeyella zoohelcum]|nr:ABC transporter permease [Bergeyella zoohelcum]